MVAFSFVVGDGCCGGTVQLFNGEELPLRQGSLVEKLKNPDVRNSSIRPRSEVFWL